MKLQWSFIKKNPFIVTLVLISSTGVIGSAYKFITVHTHFGNFVLFTGITMILFIIAFREKRKHNDN